MLNSANKVVYGKKVSHTIAIPLLFARVNINRENIFLNKNSKRFIEYLGEK